MTNETTKTNKISDIMVEMIRDLHVERHNTTGARRIEIDAILDKLYAEYFAK